MPALYLALTMETAIKEVSQGLGYRIDPCVLCCYDVDCADVVDLRTDAGRAECPMLGEKRKHLLAAGISAFDRCCRKSPKLLSD